MTGESSGVCVGCTTIRSRSVEPHARAPAPATRADERRRSPASPRRSLPRSGTADRRPPGSRSATHGVWMPPTGWPPSMPLMLIVACRAPAGTTGTAVRRDASAGIRTFAHRLQQPAHAVDGADAEKRHAAVPDPAARGHLEPVHAAMADADAIDVQRLGDDDEIGAPLRDASGLGQPRDAGEAAALFVDGAADLDRARAASRPARAIASAANTAAAIPAFMSHTPRPKILPSRTRPPNGSTVQPSPAGTTSMWPFRWTTGPGPPRREPTTFTRGCRAVCSARPSAAMYSTSNERAPR